MEKVPSISSEINKDLMSKITYKNFNDVSPYFYKLITEWMSDAYKLFNDMDKFLIMIYMINTDFEFYRRNNLNIKYEDFYNEKSLEVPKIKLSKISEDLGIPKESVRRKISFLEKKKIIRKKGKQIFIDRTAYEFQKPNNTLKNLSQMLRAFSKILKKENLLDESFDNLEISRMIKNNFSFCWYQFFKFIFAYCFRWRKYFGDLEIMLIGITIAFNSVSTASVKLRGVESYIDKWREQILQSNERGINAMSISDITGIPRPTVIRKIKNLIKLNMISIDKNKLLYIKFDEKSLKETSKLQNETINDLSDLMVRVFNQIRIN
tara:strand:- start:785 stop:1747 length:963 start_codon:yes stop_codon:yes gene_type:complete